MTQDAQNALRRGEGRGGTPRRWHAVCRCQPGRGPASPPPSLPAVIEKFTENTRFCLICNYLSKIIPALQSRCTRFRFGPLTPELMVPRLRHVIQEEG